MYFNNLQIYISLGRSGENQKSFGLAVSEQFCSSLKGFEADYTKLRNCYKYAHISKTFCAGSISNFRRIFSNLDIFYICTSM